MRTLLTFVLLMGFAAPALAAKPKKELTPEERFAKLDSNSDSKLTLEEFRGKKTGEKADKAADAFKKKDKDGDAALSLAEFKGKAKKKDK